uniref:Uncharacterized protein n=1 Tax=Knipowitschia caucasica TaxID=637954 RepID=A0AAV2KCR9_KNICA
MGRPDLYDITVGRLRGRLPPLISGLRPSPRGRALVLYVIGNFSPNQKMVCTSSSRAYTGTRRTIPGLPPKQFSQYFSFRAALPVPRGWMWGFGGIFRMSAVKQGLGVVLTERAQNEAGTAAF